ncbi:MAG: transposase [Chloroflexota bacterium]|nr:transposase [Chloroflexota bacterium]
MAPRCDAETSPERGYYYHPSRHSAGQPIVAGWAYQLVAQLGFERDSWVAPVDARRVRPTQDTDEVAAEQVRALVERLPEPEAVPIFVFDAGYDPVKPQRAGSGRVPGADPGQVTLQPSLLRGAPEEVEPRPVGRPRRHGKRFDLKDPASWPEPTREHRCESDDYGSVRVRCWAGSHPKTRRIGERYGCKRAPVVRGTVVLVEVGKLARHTRKPKKLWLWWSGEGEANLDLLWRAYCRRFDLEHTLRFTKQTLGWTTPRFRHPEQAARWTWLVLIAYTQLRLARAIVADARLPWERAQRPRRLTPSRVLRGLAALLALAGTPAKPPKPCGRSPGRPKGSRSGPAKRHPALKTAA